MVLPQNQLALASARYKVAIWLVHWKLVRTHAIQIYTHKWHWRSHTIVMRNNANNRVRVFAAAEIRNWQSLGPQWATWTHVLVRIYHLPLSIEHSPLSIHYWAFTIHHLALSICFEYNNNVVVELCVWKWHLPGVGVISIPPEWKNRVECCTIMAIAPCYWCSWSWWLKQMCQQEWLKSWSIQRCFCSQTICLSFSINKNDNNCAS